MSNNKLTYFPVRGRAETSRLILASAGIKYEDVRIAGEEWLEFKPKTPFGSMPVWEEDGKMLAGSTVIARYLAEKNHLAGGNVWENAQIANTVDFITDLMQEMLKGHFEKDATKKAELEKKFKEETIPKFLGKLESVAGDNGYLWESKLTWADLHLYQLLDYLADKLPWDKFPNLKKMRDNVEANEGVAKWLKDRPKSDF